MLRALDELDQGLGGDGLPGRRLARATAAARVRAWAAIVARHGQLPAVAVVGKDLTRPATEPGGTPRPVLVVRLDATLIEAASPQAQAAGNDKGGFGFHPLTSWCANIGDALAVMQRPGNAGSFTAQVTDLTGIMRHGPGGDRLARWPAGMRVIARRTPRPVGKPAKLGEHPTGSTARSSPTPPAGRSSFSTPAIAPRPTSKTG